ncbi:MAG TPA: hypothetical protein VFT87_00585 [Candidatus Saccharimonadales bacterium]|nr:hypothetical protein [Candidatus Saccharimonadales bacterium]
MASLTLSEIAVRTKKETVSRETLVQRAIRNRRLGGFIFDVVYAYESLKEKIVKTGAMTLGGVGMAAFMTGMAEKANALSESATGHLVASIMDDPERLTPTAATPESSSLIAAGAAAVVAAGVINMTRVGIFDATEDCGLGVINPNRDLSDSYTSPPIERFDAWAENRRQEFVVWSQEKRHQFAEWRAVTRERLQAWRADIAERRAAQVDPANTHYKPFAFTPNLIEDGPIFQKVDEITN